MTTAPKWLTAQDIARERKHYDLDVKPTRWTLSAPFETLDIRPGRVLLLGAPPGAGKTTLALQLMTDLIARHGLRCVVANVESAPPVLLDKLLARFAWVDFAAVMNRQFTRDERRRIDDALKQHADTLTRLAFMSGPFTVQRLSEAMQEFNARLAVLDYVQRFNAEDQEDRAKLDRIMSQVREYANQGAAVLVISSVARQKDHRGSSTYSGLSLAAFRGSAELEFGADSAFLLQCNPTNGAASLHCVKERFGIPRDIPLRFHGPYQRFDAGDMLHGYDAAPGFNKMKERVS